MGSPSKVANKNFISVLNSLTKKIKEAQTVNTFNSVVAQYEALILKPEPKELSPQQAVNRSRAINEYQEAYSVAFKLFDNSDAAVEPTTDTSDEDIVVSIFDLSGVSEETDQDGIEQNDSLIEEPAPVAPVLASVAPLEEPVVMVEELVAPVEEAQQKELVDSSAAVSSKKRLYITNVGGLINDLFDAADDARDISTAATAEAAREVALNLGRLLEQYHTDELTLEQFKAQTVTLLKADTENEHVKELRAHKGWKSLIVNLLSTILGHNNAQSLFNRFSWFQTKEAVKLNAISKSVENSNEFDEEESVELDDVAEPEEDLMSHSSTL